MLKTLLISLLSLSPLFTDFSSVRIDELEANANITAYAYYLFEDQELLTAEKLANGLKAEQWQQLKGKSVNLGNDPRVIWFRLAFTSDKTAERVLQCIFPYHETFEFWTKDGENWTKSLQGLSQGDNPLIHNYSAIRLTVPEAETKEVYIKVKSTRSLLFTFELLDNPQFEKEKTLSSVIYGIYFGLLIAMLLYNLFVFFSLRDISFLFYVLSIFCTLLTFSTVAGYLRLLPFIADELKTWLLAFSMVCIPVFTGLFTIYFLETKRYAPVFHKLLLFSIGFAILSFVWFGLKDSSRFINTSISLHAILMLVTGLVVWAKGIKAARFYVLAWSAYVVFGFSMTLRNLGLIEASPFVNHAAEVASAFEVILLGIALSDRYRLYKKQEEQTQRELIELQQNANQRLEAQVNERTLKLQDANEELGQINEELKVTLDLVSEQKMEIEEKNKNIVASINYARRIQESILPSADLLGKAFPEHFILYRPLHVVSGDFYFYTQKDGKDILAAIDCTGHGVPGAFMSLIGYNLLYQAINERGLTDPAAILARINQRVQEMLRKSGSLSADGMDAAVCTFDYQAGKIYFSGAMNSLLFKTPGQPLERLRGDRIPVGGHAKYYSNDSFTTHELPLIPGTLVYLTSDGFQDQFGGPKNQKFRPKRLRDLLESISDYSMQAQESKLKETFDSWKGKQRQTDDLMVIGIRLNDRKQS